MDESPNLNIGDGVRSAEWGALQPPAGLFSPASFYVLAKTCGRSARYSAVL